MQYDSIPTSFQSLPVLIETVGAGAGSGFFLTYGDGLYLITARHVILNNECKRICDELKLHFWLSKDDHNVDERTLYTLNLAKAEEEKHLHCGGNSDIAAIRVSNLIDTKSAAKNLAPLCEFKKTDTSKGVIAPYAKDATKTYDEVVVGNDAFTIGYPLSLSSIPHSALDVFRPLLRKGLIAGKYDDRKQIVIDCPVYKGNSGGPVIEIYRCGSHCRKNHFKIIGVVSQFVPLVQTWKDDYFGDSRIDRSNSGYSIVEPLDAVFDLINSST